MGRIPYVSMEGGLVCVENLPKRLVRVHRGAKALSQTQVFLGLVCFALGALADYTTSGAGQSIRLTGLPECIGLYITVTGWIGICGAASYRRGLMAALLVMSLHALFIFVPALIINSAAGMLLSQKNCYWGCNSNGESCNIICGNTAKQAVTLNPEVWQRIASDDRVDWALIVVGLIEGCVAIGVAVLCSLALCERCRLVDAAVIEQVTKVTANEPTSHENRVDVATVSGQTVSTPSY